MVDLCDLARNLPRCAKLRGRADENESKTVTIVVVQEWRIEDSHVTENGSPKPPSMFDRFRAAAQIHAGNWRDPEHDLDAIRMATPEERKAIEQFLLSRGIQHFIDAEALALLNTPTAQQALLKAFHTGTTEVKAAVAQVAPDLIPNDEQLSELLQRVDQCDAYKGLDFTLQQIESMHPPPIIETMLQRIVRDPGVVAVHYAALLLYLHGKATSAFDWDLRLFLLRFNAGDDADRRQAFIELCDQLGCASAPYFEAWPTQNQEG